MKDQLLSGQGPPRRTALATNRVAALGDSWNGRSWRTNRRDQSEEQEEPAHEGKV